jgi:hypothetical protein
MMLKIARATLIFSVLVWLCALIFGRSDVLNPLLAMAIGGWAAIAVGISAMVCILAQVAHMVSHRRRS